MLDNHEVNEILEKLESLEDEVLAVELLKEFNRLTSLQGKLILNKENSLSHDDWKKESDRLKSEVEKLILKIKNI